MNQPDELELAACVGLDWADQLHVIYLQAADSAKAESRELEQKPDALHDWIAQLRVRFEGRKVGIAIEQSRGAGSVYAPRLLTALGTDRSRWDSAADLQCHSGIAPVTEKSGKSCWVHRRLACSNFVRQTFHEFAAQSIRYSTWARAYYDQMRGRGLRHPAAIRALAFKWIRIIYRCWKDQKPYDEEVYLQSLRAKQSPLIKDDSQ